MAYRRPSTLPGRILARLLLGLVGLLLGIALFTPWHKIWGMALARLDSRLPSLGFTWDSIDHDGPLGFRVNDLRVTVAQTPGQLHFAHAYVTMRFAPLALVALDTGGSQCELELYSNGVFDFKGDLNLTYLLGNSDFKGVLHAAGSLFLPDGARLPKNGWVDVRSQQLILPGDKMVGDLAFTAELDGRNMKVRDFSLGTPVTFKTSGTGIIDPDDLFGTSFKLKGTMTVGRDSFDYGLDGTLAQAIW